ncbi:MAG: uL15 family ribosomal protein, partial [Candidatus Hydrothermarchaeales archaeon]
MATRNRKIRKKRGTRTCGGGSHKKNRGKGNRGGRGMAGTHKGRWTWVVKNAPDYFGREKGFKRPVTERPSIINLNELDERIEQLLSEGFAKKRGNKIEIDVTKINCDKV